MSYLYIDSSECMGDSLAKINTNAENFSNEIQTLTINLSALVVQVENLQTIVQTLTS